VTKPTIAFFSTCHSDDYDFILGSIEHHAEMGFHLVLDTSSPEKAEQFKRLPDTVRWVHEPLYGSGWKAFKMRTAVERAMMLARQFYTNILVSVDSDEFYSRDSVERLFPHAVENVVSVHCTHWKADGFPYMFGESEWHPRLWPAWCDVAIAPNVDWTKHASYNGNPEQHPVPVAPPGSSEIRVPGSFHHHLHYAFGPKVLEEEAAKSTIAGWPDKGVRIPPVDWPVKIRTWKTQGIRPSEYYR